MNKPRVPADMPLYDILNEFQKGSSHMAAVVRVIRDKNNPQAVAGDTGKSKDGEEVIKHSTQLTMPLLAKFSEKSDNVINVDKLPRHAAGQQCQEKGTAPNGVQHFIDNDDGEVIGIITLEDVFEELLQVVASTYTNLILYFFNCYLPGS